MEPNLTDGQALFVLAMGLLWLLSAAIQVHGIYLCFIKKWYLGAVALLVPGFAMVISVAKLLFKKDLLA